MIGNSNMHPLRDALGEREQAILRLLAEGLSDQQIADELFLSLHTVKLPSPSSRKKVFMKRMDDIAEETGLSKGGVYLYCNPGPYLSE